MRGRHARRAALLLAICSATVLSCARGGGTVALDAEGSLAPRLATLLFAQPLPAGWKTGEAVEGAVISLQSLPREGALPRGAKIIGRGYLAATADLADERFSITAAEAERLGLEPLESIVPPRRALAIDGIWPGRGGYPFETRLVLSVRGPRSGRAPRALRQWLVHAAAFAAAESDREETPLELAAAGDIQVGEYQWPLLARPESLLRGGLQDRLRAADLAVANLEAPLSARGYPNPLKRYQFRMPPGSAAALKRAGFGLLLFANNHGFDFGPEAFEDSLVDFRTAALPLAGAGENLDQASAARFLELKGQRLAFVGFAFYPKERMGFSLADAAAGQDRAGIATDEEAVLTSVRAAAASGATVIVLAHGGPEYVEEPSQATRRLYARFAEAGAALVAGSHPHLLQGCAARAGSLIAYSLGNFLFTGETEPPEALKSALLELLFYRGKVRGVRIVPVTAGYYYTSPDPDRFAAERRFSGLCARLASEGIDGE
jgi:poly-gamma-glutamate capsule biosynthesis protein CapA/YwtB (metallophosphatase superfamily)